MTYKHPELPSCVKLDIFSFSAQNALEIIKNYHFKKLKL